MARFIAEISSNHNGDKSRCLALIRAAAACGCWGVKFQLFRIEKLFAPVVLQASFRHRIRRRWELPRHFLPDLAACARDEGLAFGCTPFDIPAVEILERHVDFLKIASYELPWLGLVGACADTGLPLQMSRGMANTEEILLAARQAAGSKSTDLTILHCVSSYPVLPGECNLGAIGSLRQLFSDEGVAAKVGWSDHSVNPGVVHQAIQKWAADVVEFHFDLEGQGDEYSGGHCWLPEAIGPVIAGEEFQVPDECDGTGTLDPAPSEVEERPWRADPGDGLRPTLPVREIWQARLDRELKGPLIKMVAGGPGLGHLARLLALAEGLDKQGNYRFLFYLPRAAGAQAMVARHGFAWSEAPPLSDSLISDQPSLCILDLKDPCTGLVHSLKKAGCPSVVLDRMDCPEADLVIIPCFYREPDTKQQGVAAGPRYLLVRQDVVRMRPDEAPAVGGRIVVSFGGEDPFHLTEKVGEALAVLPEDTPVDIVLGPGFKPHRQVWPPAELMRDNFRLIETGDPLETLLPEAGLLVTALGVTVAEAQLLGVPTAVLANYESDAGQVKAMAEVGTIADLGFHRDSVPEDLARRLAELWSDVPGRQILARKGYAEVDGEGARRCAVMVAKLLCSGGSEEGEPC